MFLFLCFLPFFGLFLWLFAYRIIVSCHWQLFVTLLPWRCPVDKIFHRSFLAAFVSAAAVNKLVYAVVCPGRRWNEAWPFGPSAYSQVYQPPTATQASDNKPHEPRVKTESVDTSGEEKLIRVWQECQHRYLSECGLFIRLRVSTQRITAPVPGSDRGPQRCSGSGDLHFIMNSKDDIFILLCIWRNCGLIWHQAWQQLLVFPSEKLQQFLLPPPANSSKLLGVTNQLTTVLPATGHLEATSALCSSTYQTETPSLYTLETLRYPRQELLMLGPHHLHSIQFNSVEFYLYRTKKNPKQNKQKNNTRSPDPHISTVARKNSLLTGRNLEQDQAHKEYPSCRRLDKGGEEGDGTEQIKREKHQAWQE